MELSLLGARVLGSESSSYCFDDDWLSRDSEDSDYKLESAVSDITATAVMLKRKARKRVEGTEDNNDAVDNVSSDCDNIAGDLWGKYIPDLVLLKIFRYVVESAGAVPFLCRASQVCRLWYQCASNASLWKTVDLSYGGITGNDATMQLLCRTRFSKLTDINLSGWNSLTCNGLKLLVDTCPQLKSINLSRCRVNAMGVLYMVNKCSSLAEINLMAYGCEDVVNVKMIVEIVTKCAGNLRSLNLSRNYRGGNPADSYSAVIKELATCCPNLECLDLSNTSYLLPPLTFDLEQFQRGCQKLRILRLTNAFISTGHVSVGERNESPGFPQLQELSLGISSLISGVSVSFSGCNGVLGRLMKSSRKLRLLDLRGWSQLTCADFQSMPATDLAVLYISKDAEDGTLETVASKWQHSLVELHVSGLDESEASLDLAMKSLARLEVLDLEGTHISLGSVQSVLQGCPLLRSLNMSSCHRLPGDIQREYMNEALDHLRENIDSVAATD